MKTTTEKTLEICQPSGSGHYKIGVMYYGKLITCITSNMPDIDAYRRECFSRRDYAAQKDAYNCLRNEVIRKYKNN